MVFTYLLLTSLIFDRNKFGFSQFQTYRVVGIVEPPIDNGSHGCGTLEDIVRVLSQDGEREEPAVRPAPDGSPLGVNVGQVVLQVLSHLNRARHFRASKIFVDREEPIATLKP